MRHKIAKRIRREILKRAEIVKEGWIKGGQNKKDWWFEVKCRYNGWLIYSPDDNELSAYKMALACIKIAEEKSFTEAKDG